MANFMGDGTRGRGRGRGFRYAKNFLGDGDNNILNYCQANTTPAHPVQQELIKETLATYDEARGMGAPACLALNSAFIRSKNAKKVLDIGVFTGASALAAALAFPNKNDPDCQVIACEVRDQYESFARRFWKKAGVEDKIKLRIAPAAETLESLIQDNQAGTFDFAFIDADKPNYDVYYEKCLILMKKGGVMAFDNTLWRGQVLPDSGDTTESTEALRKLNTKLANDVDRVHVVQINVGDGYTIATKL